MNRLMLRIAFALAKVILKKQKKFKTYLHMKWI